MTPSCHLLTLFLMVTKPGKTCIYLCSLTGLDLSFCWHTAGALETSVRCISNAGCSSTPGGPGLLLHLLRRLSRVPRDPSFQPKNQHEGQTQQYHTWWLMWSSPLPGVRPVLHVRTQAAATNPHRTVVKVSKPPLATQRPACGPRNRCGSSVLCEEKGVDRILLHDFITINIQ